MKCLSHMKENFYLRFLPDFVNPMNFVPKFKGVLFDLDGTLIDTLNDIADAVNRTLEKREFPTHSIFAYREFIGDGTKQLIIRALPKKHRIKEMITSCLEEFMQDYACNFNIKSKPYKGIPALLNGLIQKDITIAILSNKPDALTRKCVFSILEKWKFDVVFGQRDHLPPKPDPAGAFEIAAKIGIDPKNILFAGDSGVDMKTAAAAGMYPVGVSWGFRSLSELKENGAQLIVNNPADLLEFICSPQNSVTS